MRNKEYKVLNYKNIKAIWLSQFDLTQIYCSGGRQRDDNTYRKLIKRVLSDVSRNGFNTVIVQVRPNADSMYPSEFYPASAYVVGTYGCSMSYDPFAILISEAHAAGLSVQAWINPLRCMTDSEVLLTDDKFAVKKWYTDPEYSGKYTVSVNGRCYVNPAYDEVRQLIIDGAEEIVSGYDVDGLHMDDYFYPAEDNSFDMDAYNMYVKSGGQLSNADFRREQLNKLVSGLYKTVKRIDPELLFGISPAGNINNVYFKQYADVYKWCSEPGYIDYICPQVYFGLEHQTHDFIKISELWQSVIKCDDIKFIVGMTLGKAKSGTDKYAGTGYCEWAQHKDILLRCLDYTSRLPKCCGTAYFCYQYFYDPVSGSPTAETAEERDNFIPLLHRITWCK